MNGLIRIWKALSGRKTYIVALLFAAFKFLESFEAIGPLPQGLWDVLWLLGGGALAHKAIKGH